MIQSVNDSGRVVSVGSRLHSSVLWANLVLGLGTAAAATLMLVRPELMVSGGDTSQLYAIAYAARAIPLGLAIAALIGLRRRQGLAPLLAVGAAAQLGDIVIAAATANPGMAFGAALCAAGHLWGLLLLGRAVGPGLTLRDRIDGATPAPPPRVSS
jgi:hypothetical protein